MTNHEDRQVPSGWPKRLPAGVLRWARSSSHYDDTIAFYRDLVGLPIVDSFTGSFGEDGTIFGLPDIQTQMEIVRSDGATHQVDEFDQMVFYLEDADAVTEATAPLRDSGLQPDSKVHSYWKANGAVIYRDPDGRGVVYAPWVFGRVPDPVDRCESSVDAGMTAIRRRSLLGALILTWGVSWPVIKVGVATVPPIWYGSFRYLIAAGAITAWVGCPVR